MRLHSRILRDLKRRLGNPRRGVTAVEYGLMVFGIAAVMVPTMVAIGPSIGSSFQKAADTISSPVDPAAGGVPTASPVPDSFTLLPWDGNGAGDYGTPHFTLAYHAGTNTSALGPGPAVRQVFMNCYPGRYGALCLWTSDNPSFTISPKVTYADGFTETLTLNQYNDANAGCQGAEDLTCAYRLTPGAAAPHGAVTRMEYPQQSNTWATDGFVWVSGTPAATTTTG